MIQLIAKSIKPPEHGHPHRDHSIKKWRKTGIWSGARKSAHRKVKLKLEEIKLKELQEIDGQAQEED
jgi:hypothetical protein